MASDPDAAPVERLDDPRPRGQIVAVLVVLVAAAVAVAVAAREPVEVVTADGLGTASGRTSNLAVTDISTEHWRVDLLPAVDEGGGGWVRSGTVADGRLVAVGAWTTTLDLATGTVLGQLPPIQGTPVLREGRLVVAVRDRLVGVDPRDGAVTELARLDRDVTAQPVFPEPLGDGWLVVSDGRVSSVAADGTVRWRVSPQLETDLRAAVEGGHLVVTDWAGGLVVLDLADGSPLWRADRSTGWRGYEEPLVAEGMVFSIEVSQEPGDRARPPSGLPTARDLATGEVVWQADGPMTAGFIGVRDGVLFATTQIGDRPIQRLETTTGRLLTAPAYDAQLEHPGSAVLGPHGSLLVRDRAGRLLALDDTGGAVRWGAERAGMGEVVVVGDLVLLSDGDGVRVVDGADGTVLHRLPRVSGGPSATIALSGRTAMVAPGFAVGLPDGEVRIDDPSAERWSTPSAVPGGFLIHSANGVRLVDVTGVERWPVADSRSGGWPQVVATIGDRVLVAHYAGEDGRLVLLDRDGEQVGAPLDGYTIMSPVIVGDLVVGLHWRARGPEAPQLVAVRLSDDGVELAWEAPTAGGVLLGEGDELYEVSAAAVVPRDLTDGSTGETALLPRLARASGLALADGTLLAAVDDTLLAIDPGSGELLWEWTAGSRITGRPSVAGDVVALGTADGDVVLLRLDGTRVAARDVADAPIRAVVAAHGLLTVVTDGHALALGPEELPERVTRPEPREIGTVDVPVP